MSEQQEAAILLACERRRYALRDRAIVLLALKAGLRPVEIAALRRSHVLERDGSVAAELEISAEMAYRGPGRVIPLHPLLREAIADLVAEQGKLPRSAPLFLSERGKADRNELEPMTPKHAGWVCVDVAEAAGVPEFNAQAARTTFQVRLERVIQEVGGTEIDVFALSGMVPTRRMLRTQAPNPAAQRRAIRLI